MDSRACPDFSAVNAVPPVKLRQRSAVSENNILWTQVLYGEVETTLFIQLATKSFHLFKICSPLYLCPIHKPPHLPAWVLVTNSRGNKSVQSCWLNIQSPAQWKYKEKSWQCCLKQGINVFWIYSNLQKSSFWNSHTYHALLHMFNRDKARDKCVVGTTAPLHRFHIPLICMCWQWSFPMESWKKNAFPRSFQHLKSY